MNIMTDTQSLTPESTAHVRIENVSKVFHGGRKGDVEALRPVSLDIKRGEFVSILGPSGCGKSTLLMLLSGLLGPSAGNIRIDGKKVDGPNSDLGIVFQQDVLLEWRGALDNVLLQAEIRGADMKEAEAKARSLLSMVSLTGFEDAYPRELSGGMRQRVSICRALLHEPPLLLMDEPFGALDAMTRDQLQIDLMKLCAERDMTVFFITHSIPEAVFLSDRVVVMTPRPGRIEDIVEIDLPRPRRLAMREDPKFTSYVRSLTETFKTLGVFREEY
ncbi:ABC transporter ATP-binding protein [Celeribacter persicus]|jgi:ABC-type nitrate/sulfonate/bicarbonate transport system, ATPase component|uniref:NitT/TauT family transport system ATP-binding protein n=1 Tax=Celeribacter persicus TaxID=1651082 RepID=A0A2T5H4C2_9RHOB|nr:ABC transporter ATP-binding protein [Celeribacter persicus]PTQ66384.1 NitT/TauT family transport system ATP-binding protein [Celeribacter persicus]